MQLGTISTHMLAFSSQFCDHSATTLRTLSANRKSAAVAKKPSVYRKSWIYSAAKSWLENPLHRQVNRLPPAKPEVARTLSMYSTKFSTLKQHPATSDPVAL